MIGAPWPRIRFRLRRHDVYDVMVKIGVANGSYLPLGSTTRICYWEHPTTRVEVVMEASPNIVT